MHFYFLGGMAIYILALFAIVGVAACLLTFLIAFFHPGLEYRTEMIRALRLNSPEFLRLVGLLSDSSLHRDTRIDVLTDGPAFYEAELAAIREAQCHICMEAYIFQKGEIASRFIEALTERARAGVEVRVVLDAAGSVSTWPRTFRHLTEAGGRVVWYNPFRWHNLPRLNNRTHRELLIIDGRVGFIGGAGIADYWWKTARRHFPRWRDTMFRVEGTAVTSMQSMFAENWLEASGELLIDQRYYPPCHADGDVMSLVVNSTPSFGRSTRSRMLFQLLLASAGRSIYLTTPYFLPDRAASKELVRAIAERGVEVKILLPGRHNDHLLTRRSSRRLYGDLLKSGAQIYEYQPSMIHTKSMVVDGMWSIVGSTNFDHRSFGINDEINLAVLDEGLADRLEQDFQEDLAKAHRVTYEEWLSRSPLERFHEWIGWILERQE